MDGARILASCRSKRSRDCEGRERRAEKVRCYPVRTMQLLLALALFVSPVVAAPQKPAASDAVKQRLEKSPRHHEWVDVKRGERTLRCFVVYPEVKTKVAAVLVIHENKGLNDWARSVADQLAEAGYIAIAPDLISGMGPKGGNTESFESTVE